MPVKGRRLTNTLTASGRKVGRPRATVPADAASRIRDLAADGFSLQGIAERLGTRRATLAQWFDADPALKEAFDIGREHERHVLHNVLFRLATEKNNPIAAMFLLKARHGYREGDQSEQGNHVSITFTLLSMKKARRPMTKFASTESVKPPMIDTIHNAHNAGSCV